VKPIVYFPLPNFFLAMDTASERVNAAVSASSAFVVNFLPWAVRGEECQKPIALLMNMSFLYRFNGVCEPDKHGGLHQHHWMMVTLSAALVMPV